MTNFKKLSLAAVVCLLWGSEWILNDGLREVPRLRLIALRCLIAAFALSPWVIRDFRQGRAASFGRNCLLGIGIIALPSALLAEATNVSPGLAVLLFAATPLVAGLFDSQGIERQGGIPGAPYILGGLAGVAFLVRGSLSFAVTQGLSVLWVALAVVSSSFAIVKARVWLRQGSLAAAVAVQMLAAAVTLGIDSLLREGVAPAGWTLPEAGSAALLGLLCSAVAYILYYQLLRQYRASQITVVQWLIPVVSFAGTTVRFRQRPDWDIASGAALAAVCAVLMLVQPAEDSKAGGSQGDPDDPLTLKITIPSGNPL